MMLLDDFSNESVFLQIRTHEHLNTLGIETAAVLGGDPVKITLSRNFRCSSESSTFESRSYCMPRHIIRHRPHSIECTCHDYLVPNFRTLMQTQPQRPLRRQ